MRLTAELKLPDLIELISIYFAGPKGMVLNRDKVEVKGKGSQVALVVELFSGELDVSATEVSEPVVTSSKAPAAPAVVQEASTDEDDALAGGAMQKILAASRKLEQDGGTEIGERPGADFSSEIARR